MQPIGMQGQGGQCPPPVSGENFSRVSVAQFRPVDRGMSGEIDMQLGQIEKTRQQYQNTQAGQAVVAGALRLMQPRRPVAIQLFVAA